jgi:predicted house-cleaning noncanonical NTP pyrophosphatase (MazG superfamily)
MGQLVRNKVPDIIRTKGEIPHCRIIKNDQEFRGMLFEKLLANNREVMGAMTSEERISACASVMEVLLALLSLDAVVEEEFLQAVRARRLEFGDLSDRIFLDSVEAKISAPVFPNK